MDMGTPPHVWVTGGQVEERRAVLGPQADMLAQSAGGLELEVSTCLSPS